MKPYYCATEPPPSQGGQNWSCGDDQTLHCVGVMENGAVVNHALDPFYASGQCRKSGTSTYPSYMVWVCCHE